MSPKNWSVYYQPSWASSAQIRKQRSLRLEAQDIALSRQVHRFESGRERHTINGLRLSGGRLTYTFGEPVPNRVNHAVSATANGMDDDGNRAGQLGHRFRDSGVSGGLHGRHRDRQRHRHHHQHGTCNPDRRPFGQRTCEGVRSAAGERNTQGLCAGLLHGTSTRTITSLSILCRAAPAGPHGFFIEPPASWRRSRSR